MKIAIEFLRDPDANTRDWSTYWYDNAQLYKKIEKYDDYFVSATMAANLGHKQATTDLMNDYQKKLHLKQDHYKTYQFYVLSKHYSHSSNYLGYMYKKGLGINKNIDEAIKCYKSADIVNNTNAMLGLGIILSLDHPTYDSQRSEDLFYSAFKGGNINAPFYCANAYQYGGFRRYPEFTHAKMLEIYRNEINLGNTYAMCEMAKIHTNDKMKHRLSKQAGDNGYGYGYSLYALDIEDKNPDKAYKFYMKGIELKDHSAHVWLCDLVIKYFPKYESDLLDYCIDNANDKLTTMYKNKSDKSNEYILLYTEIHNMKKLNASLTQENQKLAESNRKLAKENDSLARENLNITMRKTKTIF